MLLLCIVIFYVHKNYVYYLRITHLARLIRSVTDIHRTFSFGINNHEIIKWAESKILSIVHHRQQWFLLQAEGYEKQYEMLNNNNLSKLSKNLTHTMVLLDHKVAPVWTKVLGKSYMKKQ